MAAAVNLKYKTFIIYIAALSIDLGDKVYLLRRIQILYLKVDAALTKISSKYADFANIFLPNLATEFFEYIGINNYTLKLVEDQQPLFIS